MGTTTRLALAAACLLAQKLGSEARIGGPIHDIRALLTTAAQKQTHAVKDNSCLCLPWSQAYEEPNVECGSALEDNMGEKKKNQLCEGLFTKLNNNYCVNSDTHVHSEQWCYVSSQCARLNQGEHLPGTKVSYKYCGKDDPRTREMSVEALKVLSKSEDLDLSLVLKMAYPVFRPKKHAHNTQVWQFAQRAWGIQPGGHAVTNFVEGSDSLLTQADLLAMQEIRERDQHMIILNSKNDLGKHYPIGVVKGNRAYEVDMNKNGDTYQPHTWKTIMCRTGCSAWGW